MNLFYAPDLAGDLYTLSEEESRHCLKVLRLGQGDVIHITDGEGKLFEARIAAISGKFCQVMLTSDILHGDSGQSTVENLKFSYGKRNYRLHIAIAPTKNIDRFEWFLEKATEIGIDEITPVICEHSERRQLRSDRLEKVITAAMKQSLKAYHPKLNEPIAFKKFVDTSAGEQKFIAYITDDTPMLQQNCQAGKDTTVLVGPEGDFSKEEVETALNAGFRVVSLGASRLRTETAGLVACHTIYLKNMNLA